MKLEFETMFEKSTHQILVPSVDSAKNISSRVTIFMYEEMNGHLLEKKETKVVQGFK